MADKKADKKDEPKEGEKELAAKKDGAPEGEGGEAPAEGAEGEGGKLKKLGKKKLIIIGVVGLIVLLGAVGAGLYFTGKLDKMLGKKPDCTKVKEGEEGYEACAEQLAHDAEGAAPGLFIDIPDLIVNLSSMNPKQPHFLKISIKLEIEKKEDEKAFTDMLPRVIDQFQTYLRELRMEDLRGSSGLYRMKLELLTRVRAAAPGIKVRDVLFQEILVQ